MQQAKQGYYGLINHMDDRIRQVLLRCFEYGTPRKDEPTIIIFTSDHGEMLGDHQLWRKSLPYEASARVPFFIAWKNMDLKASNFDGLVSLEDVAATVFDLCGVELPEAYHNELESRSLAPALRGENCHTRERLFGECTGVGQHNFIVDGPLKYIWYAKTNEEQLFNVLEDPDECQDLSGIQAELLPKFRQQLQDYLGDRDDRSFKPEACKPLANAAPRALWGERAASV